MSALTDVPSVSSGREYEPGSSLVSVIVPIYNEQGNISTLCMRLIQALKTAVLKFEIIAVNDGSRDGSVQELRKVAREHPELKIIDLCRNYGQTAALMAGIDHASGDTIVSIDADLQNDPEDIPKLLAKLDEGYDVVSGWRKDRQDSRLNRRVPSRIANHLISFISGVKLKDYGCTLKAYRRQVLKGARLYGEMHRFVPIYASWMGARIIEVPVQHHARVVGQSNYGIERVFKVILDLMVVKFLEHYFVKPIYIFGGFGLFSLALCVVATSYMFYLKFFQGLSMILTPLPLVSTLTFLVGFMSILMGLLAEMLVRTYFESQHRAAYVVRDLINFENA